MLLPAVQSVRAAASRLQCVNNLRQLTMAVQHYHVDWDMFPPGGQGSRLVDPREQGNHFSLHRLLLFYLEQDAIYDQINIELGGISYQSISPGNRTVRDTSLSCFVCPADPNTFRPGATSYRGNAGTRFGSRRTILGAFLVGSGARAADILDGQSQTIAFSEKPVGRGPESFDPYTGWYQVHYVSTYAEPETWRTECLRQFAPQSAHGDSGTTWLVGGGIYTMFFVAEPPNSVLPDCGVADYSGVGLFTARSYHRGGVNIGMIDGSVRWTSETVDRAYWRSLGTRAGGETISTP
jgi:prepilin-type processing-associated H-X9-DG protein